MSPDSLLDERYRLLERIGGGGMAEVYLAEDVLLTRQVAVKILRSQFTGDEDFVTRFRQEARAAARLSHANIVSIFDVGCEADRHYIVMEYVAGETLKDLIKRDGPLSPVRAAEIAAQVTAALKQAHENNIVHCDIKPHNILIHRDGTAKVADSVPETTNVSADPLGTVFALGIVTVSFDVAANCVIRPTKFAESVPLAVIAWNGRRFPIVCCTKAVGAICVVFVPAGAVGAVSVPVIVSPVFLTDSV